MNTNVFVVAVDIIIKIQGFFSFIRIIMDNPWVSVILDVYYSNTTVLFNISSILKYNS